MKIITNRSKNLQQWSILNIDHFQNKTTKITSSLEQSNESHRFPFFFFHQTMKSLTTKYRINLKIFHQNVILRTIKKFLIHCQTTKFATKITFEISIFISYQTFIFRTTIKSVNQF